MDPSTAITASEDVICTELEPEREAVLLHLQTKRYYTLNETGLYIYRKLESGCTFGELVDALLADFDVSEEEAAAECDRFVDFLHREGLCNLSA